MLDAIHEKFKKESETFYELLTNTEYPIITFQFLKLEEFGLTDDLYIKMNARGKPLTSFENFKAKFEQQIKLPEYNKKEYFLGTGINMRSVPLHEYCSHKIDTDWANLFWAYVKEEIEESELSTSTNNVVPFDDMVMNMFNTFAINYIAGRPDSDKSIRDLIKTNSKELSYLQFKKHYCFTTESVTKLIRLLDILQNEDNKAKQFIPDDYYFDENILDRFLQNDFKTAAYAERIHLHAYIEYLIQWSKENDFNDIEGLKNWMRVIHNLIVNSGPYNNERESSNSIKGINAILERSNKINDFLIHENTITGFDQSQVKEEILKANLIEKSNEWKELIYRAEQHGYFDGQIEFLLRLSGISKYFEDNNNLNWDEDEETTFKNYFIKYTVKSKIVFGDNGLREEFSKNGNYLWERALLSIGDFMIWEGRNKSFLINFDRDISWKRLLKGDKDQSHPEIIKKIFNSLDTNNIKESLQVLIDNFEGEEWKKAFIETPELFDYLGTKRYVRPDSPQGFVLLKGERMSGVHAELFTYHLYINELRHRKFLPFSFISYMEVNGDSPYYVPYIWIFSWEDTPFSIEIKIESNNYDYSIYFTNISEEANEKISKTLEENGMSYSGYESLGYTTTKVSVYETVEFIEELCEDFQKFN
ncbi:MAG: hypothetical protein ACOCWG_06600 [bacterium]